MARPYDIPTPTKIPLFVSVTSDGECVLDSSVLVDKTDGDALLLHNALAGKIITSKVYPLLWIDDQHVRGLSHLRNLNPVQVDGLSEEEITQVGASLRDLVYAQVQGIVAASDQEEVIESASEALGNSMVASYEIHQLVVTPWPTKSHRVLRWIRMDTIEEAVVEELFLRSPDNLIMAFCNVDDLYYHNVENIIPLDSMFADCEPLEVMRTKEVAGTEGREIFKFQLQAAPELEDLTKWSSFAPPFNSDQRGGQRMIFRSESLASRLSDAIRSSPIGHGIHFHFVNSVFRLNKFQSTDNGFQAHQDIPYYDSIHRQRSKYTLLLYLTPGQGEPALRVASHGFHSFVAMEGVIFNQRHEHEGRPYVDGVKLFLRSELVCDMNEEESRDPEVARMFNIACYHSIFHKDLSAYATKLFNHSVACRFEPLARPTYKLHFRCFNGVEYITNGHDYWFSIADELETAAIVTIMDHFDATYNLKKFRELLSESHLLDDDLLNDDDGEILKYLWEKSDLTTPSLDLEGRVSLGCFNDLPVPRPCSCPELCNHCGFKRCTCQAEQNEDNVDLFNELCGFVKAVLQGHSLAIFDGSVRINLDDMHITDTEIHFQTTGYQERVWFAACCGGWRDWHEFIDNPVTEVEKEVRLFHLPPILYRKIENEGFHLTVDMFENAWVDRTLTFPVFRKQNDDNVPKTTDDYVENQHSL